MVRFCTCIFCFAVLISAGLTSCQKDESVKKAEIQVSADTVKKLNLVSTPGNYLASKGTLVIKLQDSTYIFDAQQDSVAFVNVVIDGNEYYGISAINKAHTVSFGISSSGMPIDELSSYVSGAQFLIRESSKANLEYTLIQNTHPQDFGIISIEKYNQDVTLAKGTFHTYLAKDTKANSPFYIVDGSFELKVK
ncbi:hypothetical protein ACPPVU_08635 [Mucilaginibacter sp. McL0603]|uniref:hypothetical protein n=1 Tax=Mucilaginibacter sp. McL0603 TaxID=3415670 RepID=UPI003CFA3C28